MEKVEKNNKKKRNIKNKEMGKIYQKGRKAAGLTQETSAEYFNVTPSYVSEIERGNTKGSIDYLINACNMYNMTPNDVLSPFIYFKIPLTDNRLFGYNSLTNEHKDIVAYIIKSLNERQIENKKTKEQS